MRAVPIKLVQSYMGFEDSEFSALSRWSRASQRDTFRNQPFDGNSDAAQVHQESQTASQELGAYVTGLVKSRAAAKACQSGATFMKLGRAAAMRWTIFCGICLVSARERARLAMP